MRRVRYRVAASLDGYIVGPKGEIDWIIPDPNVDFTSIYAQFDTVLLGRHTYALTQDPGTPAWPAGWRIYVFSRTLNPSDHPAVTVVQNELGGTVADLRAEDGRDVWLFGGASSNPPNRRGASCHAFAFAKATPASLCAELGR